MLYFLPLQLRVSGGGSHTHVHISACWNFQNASAHHRHILYVHKSARARAPSLLPYTHTRSQTTHRGFRDLFANLQDKYLKCCTRAPHKICGDIVHTRALECYKHYTIHICSIYTHAQSHSVCSLSASNSNSIFMQCRRSTRTCILFCAAHWWYRQPNAHQHKITLACTSCSSTQARTTATTPPILPTIWLRSTDLWFVWFYWDLN